MKQAASLPNCDQCAEKFSKTFRNLSVDELNYLFLDDNCEFFKRGSVVYTEGSRANGCFFIYSGILKIYKTGIEGKEQIIRFAKGGDLIGFRSVLSQERACTSSKVIEDAVLCFIPGNVLSHLIQSNPNFSLELMQITCRELGESNNYITDIAQKSVRERLAEVLILLMDTFGLSDDKTLLISLTREEMANMVGTATESVIRLLSEFKSDKMIELSGRKIRILDVKALKKVGSIF
ncbi:MAG: Crp/Fnr family transcriptional regulator [Marinifilaceae bacterium]